MTEFTLHDRFEACRELGLPGIPRAELLYYLVDVARALDQLQEDEKQHRNVSPQTILLDRGSATLRDPDTAVPLVKGGMVKLSECVTSAYGAPETFEARLSSSSDQYSLANVYQELLTGVRPLAASSLQELVMQHLTGTPNLTPLPESDQPVVGRALSKNPEDRYPNCVAFVRELMGETV
ncbi:MAG: protein kinase [Planctomycetes bacterium]|nr:protein kinase [Planctomycetota bacterium]